MPYTLMPILFDRKEAAKFLGITQRELRGLVSLYRLQPRVIGGNMYFYEEELHQYKRAEEMKAWIKLKQFVFSNLEPKPMIGKSGDEDEDKVIRLDKYLE